MKVRILGIDPSLDCTGLGTIEIDTELKTKSLIDVSITSQNKKVDKDNIIRVKPIIDEIQKKVDTFQPDFIAMEEMNVYIGKKTIKILFKLDGIIEYFAVCLCGKTLSYVNKTQEKSALDVYVKHPRPVTKKDMKLMTKEQVKEAKKKYREEKEQAKLQEKQLVKEKIIEIYKPDRELNFDECDALAVANVLVEEILERGLEIEEV